MQREIEKNMTNLSNSAAQRKSAIKRILNSEFFDYVMIAIGMMAYGMGWTLFLLPNDITTGGVSPPCCTGAWRCPCR